MISRFIEHHQICYIRGARGEGWRRLRSNHGWVLNNIEYIFIESDEPVRAWLLSNPFLDNLREFLVSCYPYWNDEDTETPSLSRVNNLNQTALRNWVRDPTQCIGQRDSWAISADRSVHGENNDANQAHEDDTCNFSVISTDVSDSPAKGEVPITIWPSSAVGVTSSPANHIPLLAKFLSQQNLQ